MKQQTPRRRGAYYKVQYFDPCNFAWKDIQKSYATEHAARAAFFTSHKCRVMMIDETGRRPL